MFSLHFDSALLPEGWASNVRVEVIEGRIASIERDATTRPRDERAKVALPGMPNVHSHAFQRGMAGLTEYRGPSADNFWSWRELMYRFCARMTPEDLEAVSAMAFAEMLESGFTRVGEFHYVHHDPAGKPYADPAEMAQRVATAAAETGIGLTLLPVFYAHARLWRPAAERRAAALHQRCRWVRNVVRGEPRECVAALPGATLGVSPHSLRAVTPEELRDVVRLAPTGPIHIHAAEQVKEVEDCVAWSGKRPVEWLLDNAAVNERWCLIHATHMTPAEITRLAASGAVAGFCPVTEANLGDGIAPAASLLAAGGCSASARIRMCRSACAMNCGSSNTRSDCATARAMSSRARCPRPGARCSTAHCAAAHGRWGSRARDSRWDRPRISSRSIPIHPRLAERAG